MGSVREFSFPTKFRFAGHANCSIGAVYADRLESDETKIVFYLGKARVAVLDMECLIIGSRKIPRCTLHPEEPFACESGGN